MTAKFPSEIRSFTPKVDLVDTIYADHVNLMQEEVAAVQTSLGTDTLASTYSGSFQYTYSWSSLGARLANIEAGLVSGVAGGVYFSKLGDTVQAPSGTIGIVLQSSSGNSADLLQSKSSSSTVNFKINYEGLPFVGTNPVLYVGSGAYNSITSDITSVTQKADAVLHPFMLAGM